MVYVVGSGPAGVSVAHALLKQGVPVTLLDAGIELEQERAAMVDAFGDSPPDTWAPAALSALRGDRSGEGRVAPRKLAYGSDFPYREGGQNVRLRQVGVEVCSSFACGGLSNLWGSAVLPYRAEDIQDWPISVNDLAPHYRAAFELMPLAARRDDLEPDFPLYAFEHMPLAPSRQAAALMRDLDAHREALKRAGIQYGQARLAVRSQPSIERGGCVYCGMCLHGCPRKLIYNSAHSLAELSRHPRFTYARDVVVDAVTESGSKVTLRCHSRTRGERITFRSERVYLAGGVLGTARILLASLGAFGRELHIKDSQYFLLPLLRMESVPEVTREALHAMAQVFLEIADCLPGGKPVHLQAYTYNDMYLRLVKRRLGPLRHVAGRLVDAFLGRLVIAQGYLHSDDSSAISARLEGTDDTDTDAELVLGAELNPRAKQLVRGVAHKLFTHRRYLGMVPLYPLMQFGKPGQGSHVGGIFPMRRVPGEFETDILGRLRGLERIHIVDASIFPSVPATTITLSVMANAHRIGSLYAQTPRQ